MTREWYIWTVVHDDQGRRVADPRLLVSVSTAGLEALANSTLVPRSQSGLDELRRSMSEGELSEDEIIELDSLLACFQEAREGCIELRDRFPCLKIDNLWASPFVSRLVVSQTLRRIIGSHEILWTMTREFPQYIFGLDTWR